MANWSWMPSLQDMDFVHMPWAWHTLHLPERPGRGNNRKRFIEATKRAKLRAQAAARAVQDRLEYLHLDETLHQLHLAGATEKARQGAQAVRDRLRWTSDGAKLAAAQGAKAVRERLTKIQTAKAVKDRLRKLQSPSARIARDKYAWTLGVFVLMITEFVAVNQRGWLKAWYSFLITSMYAIRLKIYHADNLHYFLIDFCYIGNFILLFYLHFYPNSVVLFQLVFALSTGPITVAILAWRNSLVFHNLDKMTTVVVHVMPPLMAFNLRWFPEETTNGQLKAEEIESVSWFRALVLPLIVYLYWQVCYFLKTEVVDAKRLGCNPELWTSARWLSKQGGKVVGKVVNMYGNTDSRVNRTLMGIQCIYTAVTLLPIKLFYSSMLLHGLYLLFMLFSCVHNGASYYFDVFSRKYVQQVTLEARVEEEEKAEARAEENEAAAAAQPGAEEQPVSLQALDLDVGTLGQHAGVLDVVGELDAAVMGELGFHDVIPSDADMMHAEIMGLGLHEDALGGLGMHSDEEMVGMHSDEEGGLGVHSDEEVVLGEQDVYVQGPQGVF